MSAVAFQKRRASSYLARPGVGLSGLVVYALTNIRVLQIVAAITRGWSPEVTGSVADTLHPIVAQSSASFVYQRLRCSSLAWHVGSVMALSFTWDPTVDKKRMLLAAAILKQRPKPEATPEARSDDNVKQALDGAS